MKTLQLLACTFVFLNLHAQQVKSTTDNTAIPFVELYSNYGDFIGITGEDGTITDNLKSQIADSVSFIELVHPRYITEKVEIARLKNESIFLKPVDYVLPEVNVDAKNAHKFLCLTVYFRRIQANENRPHYVHSGIAKIYVNQKNSKIEKRGIHTHLYKDTRIKDIKKKGFMVVQNFNYDVPSFCYFLPDLKRNRYSKEIENDSIRKIVHTKKKV